MENHFQQEMKILNFLALVFKENKYLKIIFHGSYLQTLKIKQPLVVDGGLRSNILSSMEPRLVTLLQNENKRIKKK